ncbi:MAG: single-stranded DNA-binding protein [Clostridiales bacterium]|nr:single-stranded DNA-binding protein [Clostridiales bacterium]
MNHIVLIGRLTGDPELKTLDSGTSVARFTLAVDRREEETDFIPIVTWGKLAELVSQYLSKGRQVAVAGRLQIRSYEAQDGQRRTFAEVVAREVKFLTRPGGQTLSGETVDDGDMEDIPF